MEDYFSNSPGLKDIFFTRGYCELYKEEDVEVEEFTFEENDQTFRFLFLKKQIPNTEFYDFETAYGFSGPLSTTADPGFIRSAWANFSAFCEETKIIAGFIRFNPLLENHKFVDTQYVDISGGGNVVVLNLKNKDIEVIFKDYDKNNRNKIRRALKNDVIIKRSDTLESLHLFKDVYYKTMKRLGASEFYWFDEDFFANIYKYLPNNFVVFSSKKDGKTIGASLSLLTNDVLYYFLSGTEDLGRTLGVANLLRHETVKFGLERNIQYINFGGGRTSDENDSLLKFKKGFSKEYKEFYIGKFLVNQNEYSKICEKWEKESSPAKVEEFGNRFLKYRS